MNVQPTQPPKDSPRPETGSPRARLDPEPIIRLVDVHFSFGALRVLNGVSLDFYPGQITVVIGPSGTGKSVLLKVIVGLLTPQKGQVYFAGTRIDRLNQQELVGVRRKIGFLFQMGALFDSMTVIQNVCFPLGEHAKLSQGEMTRRGMEVLRTVGLEGIESKMPADLSGGQRKRVALARAIILNPQVMLYDEPTTGLDPIRADAINELILSLARNLGITSIVVTHDMVSATKIADRMVMLYDGRIVADDKPAAFLGNPNPVVQRFVRGQADDDDLAQIHRGVQSVQDST